MRKILSLLLALTVFSSVCAFAATTVDYTYKNDDGYVYHFGKFEDGDTDAGLVINGKKLSLTGGNHVCADEGCTNAFEHAKANKNLFGMGIKLENGDSSYTMAPYATTAKGDEVGKEDTIQTTGVSEFPEVTLSNDVSIASLEINGEDADAVSGNTYYVAVEDIDNYEGQITATATDANATVNISDIIDNQATVTVTAEDGKTTGTYTVKFKEMEQTQLEWVSREKWNTHGCLYLEKKANGTYDTGVRHSGNANNLFSASYNSVVMFIEYSTTELPTNSIIVGNANISGSGDRASLYQFYNTHYETITNSCTFDEFTNGAKFLGEQEQATNWTKFNLSIDFPSSKLDIKSNGNIHIALVDGNDNSIVARCTEVPTLTINYITLD